MLICLVLIDREDINFRKISSKEKGDVIMHKKVQEFFDKKRAEELKVREEILIELGIYEKKYSPDSSKANSEYPFVEHDAEGNSKWYKQQAIDVTDEEYEEIIKCASLTKKEKTNATALIITIVAVITYIIGFIHLFYGNYWMFVIAGLAGTLGLGFAEIIRFLKNKR